MGAGVATTRSIPTCVGNTKFTIGGRSHSPVHPHVRGEYADLRAGAWRARRSIPTCVGNTPPRSSSTSAGTVHPHVRGEYGHLLREHGEVIGPSPRAWGIPHAAAQKDRFSRSIPTCVGNTHLARVNSRFDTVHPHVRGEYLAVDDLPCAHLGPSPRAWGIPQMLDWMIDRCRSIPTCVGNTLPCVEVASSLPVHPHVRGEYVSVRIGAPAMTGPSPRAWGIHVDRNKCQ